MSPQDYDINLPHDADDLSKHAPALFRLKGTEEGFVVPALYFEELSELVIAKTSIPEEGGLVVPENYFEELPSLIEAKTVIPSEDGFNAPENYFEELTSLIEAKVAIPVEDGLPVPESYFEELAENIESRIALESVLPKTEGEIPAGYFAEMESELHVHIALDNVKQDEGFVVPDQYFSRLTERIMSNLDGAGIERSRDAQSDNDSSLEDPNVPAGYFDELPERILSRLESEEETPSRGRVIVFAEWMSENWRPVSVAASVALLIGFTWLMLAGNNGASGNLQMASNTKTLVPANYVRVIPVPVVDTTPEMNVVVPEGVAIVKTPKKPDPVKPNVVKQVIMNEDEIIAQSDLMDEGMLMDFVAESNAVQPTEEVLDADMMEYLMNDNAGLDVFGPGDKKK